MINFVIDSFSQESFHFALSRIFITVMFLRFFLVFVVGFAASALVGGWSPADVNSPPVVEAGNFAVNTQFPDLHPRFKITQARKQVMLSICIGLCALLDDEIHRN